MSCPPKWPEKQIYVQVDNVLQTIQLGADIGYIRRCIRYGQFGYSDHDLPKFNVCGHCQTFWNRLEMHWTVGPVNGALDQINLYWTKNSAFENQYFENTKINMKCIKQSIIYLNITAILFVCQSFFWCIFWRSWLRYFICSFCTCAICESGSRSHVVQANKVSWLRPCK